VLGLTEPLRRLGVPLRQLNAPRKCRLGPGLPRVGISTAALEADVIINLPKFKMHQQLVATFAVKNMFGCVSGKHKALWHFRKGDTAETFCRLLLGVYAYLKPALTLIDGVVAMEGQGPIRGPSKPLGWLLAGTDPMALEMTCCRLIGLAPEQVPMIQAARQAGFGCSDPEAVEIVGDPLPATACPDFRLPEMAPIKFSISHVCRSLTRQMLLLANGWRAKGRGTSDD
jgi:uncharacterized protein (DUF362 family)